LIANSRKVLGSQGRLTTLDTLQPSFCSNGRRNVHTHKREKSK